MSLNESFEKIISGLNQVSNGLNQVTNGLEQVSTGLEQASNGLKTASDGLVKATSELRVVINKGVSLEDRISELEETTEELKKLIIDSGKK